MAHEITIENGVVVATRLLSRAEDLPMIVVPQATEELWSHREQAILGFDKDS